MIGYQKFYDFFFNLNEYNRRKILENIFSINNILLYSISLRENKLFIRFYCDDIFYQFIFIFDVNDEEKPYFKFTSSRIVHFMIYPFYYFDFIYYPFYEFVKMLSSNEDNIQDLFNSFL